MSENHIAPNRLLLESGSSSEALARLYRYRKAFHPKFSMGYVCKKAGIPSSGYLSDVIHGRKVLHSKYAEAVAVAMGLRDVAVRYFGVLVVLDHAAEADARAALERELNQLRGLLSIETSSLPPIAGDVLVQLLVLSSFSLLGGDVTRERLRVLFPAFEIGRFDQLLDRLIGVGLVEDDEGVLRLAKNRIIFRKSDDGLSHIEFLRESIAHAGASVERWYGSRQEAIFSSTIITVRREHLPRSISALREVFLRAQTDLDAEKGDALLHFNVQVYPHSE